MRICINSIIVMFLAPAACFSQGEVLKNTLTHEGIERSYNLYVPSNYSSDNPTPFVVNMHGFRGNADQQMISSAMNTVAEAEGFLVAYPNAAINGDWSRGDDHNIGFIDSLLDAVKGDYSVDASRIYATGFSGGAMMSYILGVARSDTFAAIAPVSGTRWLSGRQNLFPSFVPRTPSRPMPLLHIHGTNDRLLPYDGGEIANVPGVQGLFFASVDTIMSEWVSSNGCDKTASTTELPDISTADDSTASLLAYGDCDTYTSASGENIPADVLHYRVNGANHSWPVLEADREAALASVVEAFGEQALPAFVPLNSDLNASAAIWDFFEQHTIAVPEPSSLSLSLLALLSLMAKRRFKALAGRVV